MHLPRIGVVRTATVAWYSVWCFRVVRGVAASFVCGLVFAGTSTVSGSSKLSVSAISLGPARLVGKLTPVLQPCLEGASLMGACAPSIS